jgi:hypothetical protein
MDFAIYEDSDGILWVEPGKVAYGDITITPVNLTFSCLIPATRLV